MQNKFKVNSNNKKLFAGLSLDLDNQWSYMKTHGDSGWEDYPSYLDVFIPQFLDVLDRLKLKITFFIVGQDAALEKNKEAFKLLTKRGHEVGNHSFHHEPWIHSYSREQLKREVLDTEELIVKVTGQKPLGFRGPGFTWNPHLFAILVENGYIYDASTFPTYFGPLARLYYFWTSGLSREEKNRRKDLYGSLRDGLRPMKPYFWLLPSGEHLLEIPVTTIPVVKVPFHLSYLIYLGRFSEMMMMVYLNSALLLCKLTGTSPSFLLHPLDFLGREQVPELAFFPGMDLDRERKMRIFHKVIKTLLRHFKLVDMNTYAKTVLMNKKIKIIEANHE